MKLFNLQSLRFRRNWFTSICLCSSFGLFYDVSCEIFAFLSTTPGLTCSCMNGLRKKLLTSLIWVINLKILSLFIQIQTFCLRMLSTKDTWIYILEM